MNPYAILRLKTGATLEEIKHAYRTLAKQYHPDVNHAPDAADKFKEIQAAFEALTNPKPEPVPQPVYNPGFVYVRVWRSYGFTSTTSTADTTSGFYW